MRSTHPASPRGCTKRSPLASVVRSSCVHSTPAFCAKPSSARVGAPLASSAMLTYGPSTSDFCPAAFPPRRQRHGEPTRRVRAAWHRCVECDAALFQPATRRRRDACARPGNALTGSSSVPSSISSGFMALIGRPLRVASRSARPRSSRWCGQTVVRVVPQQHQSGDRQQGAAEKEPGPRIATGRLRPVRADHVDQPTEAPPVLTAVTLSVPWVGAHRTVHGNAGRRRALRSVVHARRARASARDRAAPRPAGRWRSRRR